jgi:hypothetical protein
MSNPKEQPAYGPKQSFISKILGALRSNSKEFSDWFKNTVWRQEKDAVEHFFKHVKWHFKEILLSFLLLFLFSSLDKVQHFFTAFATDLKAGTYSMGTMLFGLTMHGFAVLWLSYVFWHKPKNLKWRHINLLFGDRRDRSYESYYNLPYGFWWVAVISSLPVLLINIALSVSLLQENSLSSNGALAGPMSQWILDHRFASFLLGVLCFVVLSIFFKPLARPEMTLRQHSILFLKHAGALGLSIIALILLFTQYADFSDTKVARTAFLLLFVFLPPVLLSYTWHAASRCLALEKSLCESKADRPYDKLFDALRFFSYGLGIVIFFLMNQSWVTSGYLFSILAAPVTTLIFGFVFYYQAWDFILHNVTRMRRNIAFFALILLSIFFSRNEHLTMKFLTANPAKPLKRETLDNYFLAWAKQRYEQGRDSVVYIVTAEGGGSRSGAWTSAVLTELDYITNGRFRRQCLAISSVSGGSIGSAAILSLWDHADRTNAPQSLLYRQTNRADTVRDERSDSKYIDAVFRRNYISNSVTGLFFYDIWQAIPGINIFYTADKSRTARQLDAENDAVVRGLHMVFEGQQSLINPNYFLETPFLRLNYSQSEMDSKPMPRVNLPLFFPNTTRVEDGRRGVCSPIDMGGSTSLNNSINPFIAAVDVIGMAAEQHAHQSIGLAEATALSQLFPYVNATVQIDAATGTFMDGGAYENMGLTTASELRDAVEQVRRKPADAKLIEMFGKDSLKIPDFKRYLSALKFKFVLIYNVDNQAVEGKCLDLASSRLLDPLTTLMQTPFSGHTNHAYRSLLRKCAANKDEVIEFPLIYQTSCDKRDVDIVMSRWLSKYDLKTIFKQSQKKVKANPI